MRITPNYTMNTHSQNIQKCNKPNFQANLIPHVQGTLIIEAKKVNKLTELLDQFANIKNWGDEKSFINAIKTPDHHKDLLVLDNYYISNKHHGNLNAHAKDDILTQFLNLKEYNVLNAEKDLQELALKKTIHLKAWKNNRSMIL